MDLIGRDNSDIENLGNLDNLGKPPKNQKIIDL